MNQGMTARVQELSAGRVPFVHATVVRAQLVEHQGVRVVQGLAAVGDAGPPELAVDRPLAAGEQELPGVGVVVTANVGTPAAPHPLTHGAQCANRVVRQDAAPPGARQGQPTWSSTVVRGR